MTSILSVINSFVPFADPSRPLWRDILLSAALCTLLYVAPQIDFTAIRQSLSRQTQSSTSVEPPHNDSVVQNGQDAHIDDQRQEEGRGNVAEVAHEDADEDDHNVQQEENRSSVSSPQHRIQWHKYAPTSPHASVFPIGPTTLYPITSRTIRICSAVNGCSYINVFIAGNTYVGVVGANARSTDVCPTSTRTRNMRSEHVFSACSCKKGPPHATHSPTTRVIDADLPRGCHSFHGLFSTTCSQSRGRSGRRPPSASVRCAGWGPRSCTNPEIDPRQPHVSVPPQFLSSRTQYLGTKMMANSHSIRLRLSILWILRLECSALRRKPLTLWWRQLRPVHFDTADPELARCRHNFICKDFTH